MRELFIRVTPEDEDIGLDNVKNILVECLESLKYVISREEASRIHYHMYVVTSFNPERVRYRIKSSIHCQVYISGKDVIDKVKTIAYTIKDGSYLHRGIDVNELLMAQSLSHKKITFDAEIQRIKEDKNLDDEQLVSQVIDTYVKFNRKIYNQHIVALIKGIKLERDMKYAERVKKEILMTINGGY